MTRAGLGRSVLVAGCLYEVAALVTGRVPTITAIIKSVGRGHPVGRLLVWSWCGYIAWHFLEPDGAPPT